MRFEERSLFRETRKFIQNPKIVNVRRDPLRRQTLSTSNCQMIATKIFKTSEISEF